MATLPDKLTLSLADGRPLDVDVGVVMAQIRATTVAIAPCEEPLLGVETLEAMGLAVDPTNGTLTPTRAWTVRLGSATRLAHSPSQ